MYKIVSKYIKDLSFEIAGAKTYFLLQKDIKDFLVNFDIQSKKINENVIEIDTTLYLVSKKDSKMSPISICFSTLVNLEKKLEKSQMEEIILVEVPKTVYPEIRSTLIFLFEKSGFKDVKISENVDFLSLFNMRKTQ